MEIANPRLSFYPVLEVVLKLLRLGHWGESEMPSIRENLQLVELVFGTHFHVDITLNPQLGEKFYREITRVRSDLFTTKLIQIGAPFVFFHERFRTQCLITENNLVFTERKYFDNERFANICHSLTKKLIETFECNEDNFRVLGKIYRYRLRLPSVFEGFKKSVSMFANDEIHHLRLRTLLKEQGKNIHLQFSSAEEGGQLMQDTLAIECDINNADQEAYHRLDLLHEVFKFADEYNNNRLIDFLSEKLQLK